MYTYKLYVIIIVIALIIYIYILKEISSMKAIILFNINIL